MKVSIIIVTYQDNEDYLKQAIASCYASEKVEVDLIISTIKGDTAIRIAKESGIKKIVINQEPHIYKQLNAALKYVEGEWYCLFSGNDIIFPRKLIIEINCALKNKKKVCYSAFHVTDKNLNIIGTTKLFEYDYEKHLIGNFVYDGALMHKSIFDKYMPYQIRWKDYACWDFWLRVYEGEGNIFAYNPIPILKYRQTENSIHIKRKKDKKLFQEYVQNRNIMLSHHKK